MKYLVIISVLFFSACEFSSRQYVDLKFEISLLKGRIDSLKQELDDLKFGAKNLLKEAKLYETANNFIRAKTVLVDLISKYPDSKEYNSAISFLKIISPKAETQLFFNAEKSKNLELLKAYTSEYPKGKYYIKATGLIRNQQVKNNSITEAPKITTYQSVKKITYQEKQSNKSPGERIGAICCDGTRSYATGRGACSHHGGVCKWLYQ